MIDLTKLSRQLTFEEIDFRVGMIRENDNGAFCTLLAYKDARVDMKVLDEVVGQGYWSNAYDRDSNGVLQCGIGIYVKDLDQWVWKWSNGTESNKDKEKGEYSDAFKRAGFMWGIGRHLYDMPFLYCKLKPDEYRKQGDRVTATFAFKPNEWTWEIKNGKIQATDKDGHVRVSADYK